MSKFKIIEESRFLKKEDIGRLKGGINLCNTRPMFL